MTDPFRENPVCRASGFTQIWTWVVFRLVFGVVVWGFIWIEPSLKFADFGLSRFAFIEFVFTEKMQTGVAIMLTAILYVSYIVTNSIRQGRWSIQGLSTVAAIILAIFAVYNIYITIRNHPAGADDFIISGYITNGDYLTGVNYMTIPLVMSVLTVFVACIFDCCMFYSRKVR